MLLCCRVVLQVSPPGGCLLALSTKETFLQSRLDSRRGGKHRGRQALLQNLDSGSEILRKEKNCAVGYCYFNCKTWNHKVPPKSSTLLCNNKHPQYRFRTLWMPFSKSKLLWAMGRSRLRPAVFPNCPPYLNFIPGGEQVCRQNVFNLCGESLKIKNTIPHLYSWGWTGL